VSTTVATTPSVGTFPTATVEACLRSELIDAVKAEAAVKGIALPTSPAQIAKTAIHIDSLVAVCVACAVEPIIGFELPDSVVRAGGYTSVESALGQLLAQIKNEWIKWKGSA
jgi:hypothetical protein